MMSNEAFIVRAVLVVVLAVVIGYAVYWRAR
jgi:hypothetical protein